MTALPTPTAQALDGLREELTKQSTPRRLSPAVSAARDTGSDPEWTVQRERLWGGR